MFWINREMYVRKYVRKKSKERQNLPMLAYNKTEEVKTYPCVNRISLKGRWGC